MANLIADAVSAAMTAVAGALPSLSLEMVAGSDSGSVVLCSSVDAGLASATQTSVNSTRRIVANVEDFPDLAVTQPVTLGESRHIIVGLKKSGEAAWFADLSSELVPVVAKIKINGTVHSFTAMCAVVDEMAYSTTLGITSHSVGGDQVTVFVPFEEWNSETVPAFGTRFVLPGGRGAVVQNVEKTEYAWRCEAVASMSGIQK